MKPRIPEPCLCLVTDASRTVGRTLEEVVRRAVEGGVNMVQLREKQMPAGQLFTLTRSLREVTLGRAMLFVNDRVDIALACGGDGVQLGEDALPVSAARQLAGGRLLIGKSVHNVEGAAQAEADGADLLIAGTVFPSASHPGGETGGLMLLEEIASRVTIPFLAIGGITAANARSSVESGATGVAIITAISLADSPALAASKLMEEMRHASMSKRQHETARRT